MHEPVGVAVKDIAFEAVDPEFDSRAGQIGHWVAAMFFRSCVAQALSAEMNPAPRYTLRRNTAGIIKVRFFSLIHRQYLYGFHQTC